MTAETDLVSSRTVTAGETYEHFKGGRYRVLAVARSQTDNPGDHVVYQSLGDESVWVRPVSEWWKLVRWPDGVFWPRFRRLEPVDGDDPSPGPCAVSVP